MAFNTQINIDVVSKSIDNAIAKLADLHKLTSSKFIVPLETVQQQTKAAEQAFNKVQETFSRKGIDVRLIAKLDQAEFKNSINQLKASFQQAVSQGGAPYHSLFSGLSKDIQSTTEELKTFQKIFAGAFGATAGTSPLIKGGRTSSQSLLQFRALQQYVQTLKTSTIGQAALNNTLNLQETKDLVDSLTQKQQSLKRPRKGPLGAPRLTTAQTALNYKQALDDFFYGSYNTPDKLDVLRAVSARNYNVSQDIDAINARGYDPVLGYRRLRANNFLSLSGRRNISGIPGQYRDIPIGGFGEKTTRQFIPDGEQIKSPGQFDLSRFKEKGVKQQLAFALLFGGLSGLGGAAVGAAFGGSAGALIGSTVTQFAKNLIEQPLNELKSQIEKISQAGVSFERSILGISAVRQASTEVVNSQGGPVGSAEALAFQSREARQIQLAARSRLLPLGIAGQTESTFVQGIVSALAQRGLSATPEQVAKISENIGGAVQAQRPALLENTQLLLRDLQDTLGGGPLAKRTILSQLIRPALGGIENARSAEDVVKATDALAGFAEAAKNLQNPVVVLNKLGGAIDNINTAAGDKFLQTVSPALQELFKALSSEEVKDSIVNLTEQLGNLTNKFIQLTPSLIKFGSDLTDFVSGAIKFVRYNNPVNGAQSRQTDEQAQIDALTKEIEDDEKGLSSQTSLKGYGDAVLKRFDLDKEIDKYTTSRKNNIEQETKELQKYLDTLESQKNKNPLEYIDNANFVAQQLETLNQANLERYRQTQFDESTPEGKIGALQFERRTQLSTAIDSIEQQREIDQEIIKIASKELDKGALAEFLKPQREEIEKLKARIASERAKSPNTPEGKARGIVVLEGQENQAKILDLQIKRDEQKLKIANNNLDKLNKEFSSGQGNDVLKQQAEEDLKNQAEAFSDKLKEVLNNVRDSIKNAGAVFDFISGEFDTSTFSGQQGSISNNIDSIVARITQAQSEIGSARTSFYNTDDPLRQQEATNAFNVALQQSTENFISLDQQLNSLFKSTQEEQQFNEQTINQEHKLFETIDSELIQRQKLNYVLQDSVNALQEFKDQAKLREVSSQLGLVGQAQAFQQKYGYLPPNTPGIVGSALSNPDILKNLQRQQAEEQFNVAARAEQRRPEDEIEQQFKLQEAIDDNRTAFNNLTDTIDKARQSWEDLLEGFSQRTSPGDFGVLPVTLEQMQDSLPIVGNPSANDVFDLQNDRNLYNVDIVRQLASAYTDDSKTKGKEDYFLNNAGIPDFQPFKNTDFIMNDESDDDFNYIPTSGTDNPVSSQITPIQRKLNNVVKQQKSYTDSINSAVAEFPAAAIEALKDQGVQINLEQEDDVTPSGLSMKSLPGATAAYYQPPSWKDALLPNSGSNQIFTGYNGAQQTDTLQHEIFHALNQNVFGFNGNKFTSSKDFQAAYQQDLGSIGKMSLNPQQLQDLSYLLPFKLTKQLASKLNKKDYSKLDDSFKQYLENPLNGVIDDTVASSEEAFADKGSTLVGGVENISRPEFDKSSENFIPNLFQNIGNLTSKKLSQYGTRTGATLNILKGDVSKQLDAANKFQGQAVPLPLKTDDSAILQALTNPLAASQTLFPEEQTTSLSSNNQVAPKVDINKFSGEMEDWSNKVWNETYGQNEGSELDKFFAKPSDLAQPNIPKNSSDNVVSLLTEIRNASKDGSIIEKSTEKGMRAALQTEFA